MPIDTQSFFLALFPDSLNGHRLEIRKLPSAQQTFAQSIEEAVQAATDRTVNIYFGVALRRGLSGKEEDAVAIPALWSDIDVVKDYDADWQRAGEVLATFPLGPSIIVRTGGGWQPYWLLKELEKVTPDNLSLLRGYLLGIAQTLGGDIKCRDLSRIMRVPNTLHAKDDKGRVCLVRDCPAPKLVEVIRFYPERRYNLMDFDPWHTEDTGNGKPSPCANLGEIPATLPERFTMRLQTDVELRTAWEGQRQPPKDRSRSGFDAMMASMLVAREFTDEDIAAVLQHYTYGKAREEKAGYLSRTLLRAKMFVTDGCKGQVGDGEDPETNEADAPKPKPSSQADRLVKLCVMNVQLFHDQTQTPYARVRVGDHWETWPCRGRAFRRWLSRKFFVAEEKAPSSEALACAANVIEAIAVFEGERNELHNRVALHDGAIFYDLTDPLWRAVRITSGGWEIVVDPPILFLRREHHAHQVEPVRGGDVRRVFDFIPVSGNGPRILLLVYLVSCFIPSIPHPVPVLHGPQGSGKSFTFRALRQVIDPSVLQTLSLPRDTKEFVQMLAHHWAPLFDNVSGLTDSQSDMICRAVTGEGFSKRVLYSDDEDFIYRFRRCVGLNGINIAATRPDLLDRSILLSLDRISMDKRRPEEELCEAFEEARPHILGGVLDALTKAMRLFPEVRLSSLPRMADFAKWGCAIAQALGYRPEDFMRAYGENIEAQNDEVLQAHPVAAAVLGFIENKEIWEGNATELLTELEKVAEAQKINVFGKEWPKGPSPLSRRLNEIRPNLEDAGITITPRQSGGRTVTIRKMAKNAVRPAQTSGTLDAQSYAPERYPNGTDLSAPMPYSSNPLQDNPPNGTDGTNDIIPPSTEEADGSDNLLGGRF
ncbi:MAG: hypothetical protein EXS64_15400 [Candidatus Latescibacteria bacterium]|nr:hypothetical protein [Candidatus Latescibacterota bacterium]